MVWSETATAAPEPPKAAAGKDVATDDLQRSLRLDNYTVVADSGPVARRDHLLLQVFEMCHNKYTKRRALSEGSLPAQELGVRTAPVSDDSRHGQDQRMAVPAMPAFRYQSCRIPTSRICGRTSARATAVWKARDPPANPWYRAQTHKWPVQSGLAGGARRRANHERRLTRGRRRPACRAERGANHDIHETPRASSSSRAMQAGLIHACAFRRLSLSSPTGEMRSRSTARRSSTTSCWKGFPTRTICRSSPELQIAAERRGDLVERSGYGRRKGHVAEKIAPAATRGSRSSGAATTNTVGG